MITESKKVELKDGQGTVVASQDYSAVIFDEPLKNGESWDHRFAQMHGYFTTQVPKKHPLELICSKVTRAHDLDVRAGIRQKLVKATEGPDRTYEKMAKMLLSVNPTLTLEQAIAAVKALNPQS